MINAKTYASLVYQFQPGNAWGPAKANVYMWSFGYEAFYFSKTMACWTLRPSVMHFGE